MKFLSALESVLTEEKMGKEKQRFFQIMIFIQNGHNNFSEAAT